MNISVIGLGKLGSPMAAIFASKGHRVIGVDVDQSKVDAINQGKAPVDETGLQELMDSLLTRTLLTATTDIHQAIIDTDITFVVTATPSNEDGSYSIEYVLKACNEIAEVLIDKNYHPIVITSTVLPGQTHEIIKHIENRCGRRNGFGFNVYYNPEFIALGSVIHDFKNPDMLLIGNDNPEFGQTLLEIYHSVCENNPTICTMNIVNAELTKIALNSYVTTKISYANMLRRLCEKIPGANVDIVTDALGCDSRIGKKYLKGAVSYGGPCFPRDNRALSFVAEKVEVYAPFPKITHEYNEHIIQHAGWLTWMNGDSAMVVGLSYKPETVITEESFGIKLQEELNSLGLPNKGWDSDVIILALPKLLFKSLDSFKDKVVIDCWRAYPLLESVCRKYIPLGVGRKQ